MRWFVLDERGRETGPMDDDSARGWVASGRCLGVRSEVSKKWTTAADSVFAEEREPTLGSLTSAQAGKVIADAVALGAFKASIALIGLGFLLGLLWWVMR